MNLAIICASLTTESIMDTETKTSKIHPLTAAAAVAVILVSVTGIAAMTGLLPNFSKSSEPTVVAADSASASAPEISGTPTASQPVATAEKAPEIVPVKKPAVKKPVVVARNTEPQPQEAPAPATAPEPAAPPPPPPPPPCMNCGVVEAVNPIQQQAPTSGVGAAAGALLGGVLGHQVGGGNGKTLATIAGAVGGGLAGNAVEKNKNTTTGYEIIVRMEDGSRQRFIIKEQRWRSGDHVRVDNGNLSASNQ